jgi:hypothetical protein
MISTDLGTKTTNTTPYYYAVLDLFCSVSRTFIKKVFGLITEQKYLPILPT